MIPQDFVERFKNALQDVRDQSVEVSPTVVLAQFQEAIKTHADSTKFMADMKVDIYDQNFMGKVYNDFMKDQAPAQPSLSGSIFGPFNCP